MNLKNHSYPRMSFKNGWHIFYDKFHATHSGQLTPPTFEPENRQIL